jgi:hypothetical protein
MLEANLGQDKSKKFALSIVERALYVVEQAFCK